MSATRSLFICALFFLGLFPSQAGAQDTLGPAAAGEKLFRQYCSSCHGPEGRGNGPVAGQLSTAVPNLEQIAARRKGSFPEAEITSIIDGRTEVSAHGSREMPVWGRRFSEQFGSGDVGEEATRGYVAALIVYLKSIQK